MQHKSTITIMISAVMATALYAMAQNAVLSQLGAKGVTEVGGSSMYGHYIPRLNAQGRLSVQMLPVTFASATGSAVVYVDPVTGVDAATATGGPNSPFKTITYAQANYAYKNTVGIVYVLNPGVHTAATFTPTSTGQANVALVGFDRTRTSIANITVNGGASATVALSDITVTGYVKHVNDSPFSLVVQNAGVGNLWVGGAVTPVLYRDTLSTIVTSVGTYTDTRLAAADAVGYTAGAEVWWDTTPTTVAGAIETLASRVHVYDGTNANDILSWSTNGYWISKADPFPALWYSWTNSPAYGITSGDIAGWNAAVITNSTYGARVSALEARTNYWNTAWAHSNLTNGNPHHVTAAQIGALTSAWAGTGTVARATAAQMVESANGLTWQEIDGAHLYIYEVTNSASVYVVSTSGVGYNGPATGTVWTGMFTNEDGQIEWTPNTPFRLRYDVFVGWWIKDAAEIQDWAGINGNFTLPFTMFGDGTSVGSLTLDWLPITNRYELVKSDRVDIIGNVASNAFSGLEGKSGTNHVHTIPNVTGLQTALDGKAAITGTVAYATSSERVQVTPDSWITMLNGTGVLYRVTDSSDVYVVSVHGEGYIGPPAGTVFTPPLNVDNEYWLWLNYEQGNISRAYNTNIFSAAKFYCQGNIGGYDTWEGTISYLPQVLTGVEGTIGVLEIDWVQVTNAYPLATMAEVLAALSPVETKADNAISGLDGKLDSDAITTWAPTGTVAIAKAVHNTTGTHSLTFDGDKPVYAYPDYTVDTATNLVVTGGFAQDGTNAPVEVNGTYINMGSYWFNGGVISASAIQEIEGAFTLFSAAGDTPLFNSTNLVSWADDGSGWATTNPVSAYAYIVTTNNFVSTKFIPVATAIGETAVTNMNRTVRLRIGDVEYDLPATIVGE